MKPLTYYRYFPRDKLDLSLRLQNSSLASSWQLRTKFNNHRVTQMWSNQSSSLPDRHRGLLILKTSVQILLFPQFSERTLEPRITEQLTSNWKTGATLEILNQKKAHKTLQSELSKQKRIPIFSQESGETRQTDVGQNWDHSSEYRHIFPPEKHAGQEVTPFGLARSKDVKLIKKSV